MFNYPGACYEFEQTLSDGKVRHQFESLRSDSIPDQIEQFRQFKRQIPKLRTDHQSRFYARLIIPQLERNLTRLKMLNSYQYYWLPDLMQIVAPIQEPFPGMFKKEENYQEAKRAHDRLCNEARQPLSQYAFDQRVLAPDVEYFYAPYPSGVLHRPGLDLQPEWIEFTFLHPGTRLEEIRNNLEFCAYFILCAFDLVPMREVKRMLRRWRFPAQPRYHHELQMKTNRVMSAQ